MSIVVLPFATPFYSIVLPKFGLTNFQLSCKSLFASNNPPNPNSNPRLTPQFIALVLLPIHGDDLVKG